MHNISGQVIEHTGIGEILVHTVVPHAKNTAFVVRTKCGKWLGTNKETKERVITCLICLAK